MTRFYAVSEAIVAETVAYPEGVPLEVELLGVRYLTEAELLRSLAGRRMLEAWRGRDDSRWEAELARVAIEAEAERIIDREAYLAGIEAS